MNSYRRLSLVLLAGLTAGTAYQSIYSKLSEVQKQLYPRNYTRSQRIKRQPDKALSSLSNIKFQIDEESWCGTCSEMGGNPSETTFIVSGFENLYSNYTVICPTTPVAVEKTACGQLRKIVVPFIMTIKTKDGSIECFIYSNKIKLVRTAKGSGDHSSETYLLKHPIDISSITLSNFETTSLTLSANKNKDEKAH